MFIIITYSPNSNYRGVGAGNKMGVGSEGGGSTKLGTFLRIFLKYQVLSVKNDFIKMR